MQVLVMGGTQFNGLALVKELVRIGHDVTVLNRGISRGALFGLQRIAPHLHHWNRSVCFGIERLRRDVGWEPEYSFPEAVAQTWEWMQRKGLDRRMEFDFGFEDELLARIRGSGG